MSYPHPNRGAGMSFNDTYANDASPGIKVLHTPESSPRTESQQLRQTPSAHSRNGSGMQRPARSSQQRATGPKMPGRIEKSSSQSTAAVSPSLSKRLCDAASVPEDTKPSGSVQPLSEIAGSLGIVPIDIESFVNRSKEERHLEIQKGKNPGKVKRSMNGFMLYRKSYQNVAKASARHSNHQVVSKICGDSWGVESKELRERFNQWANVERENHRLAHPDYKFTPSKPKKKLRDSDDELAGGEMDLSSAHFYSGGPANYDYPYGTVQDISPYHSFHGREQHSIQSSFGRPTHQGYDQEGYPAPYYRSTSAGPSEQQNYGTQSQHQSSYSHQVDGLPYQANSQPMQIHASYGQGYPSAPAPSTPFVLSSNAPSHHQNVHHTPSAAQQVDPSLMPRNDISQYDVANPVLGSSGHPDGQWQGNFSGASTNPGLYPGPYVADVEESLMTEQNHRFMQDEHEWIVGSSKNDSHWPGQ